MEDVVLRMPTKDVVFLSQFAERMGWTIDSRSSAISRFIAACQNNETSDLSDDDIQAEVNAVRYKR